MRKPKGEEIDLHIWMKPETKNMTTLFTVSIGKRAVCIDMPIDEATRCIRGVLGDMEDEG
jgi:hypothetical protein